MKGLLGIGDFVKFKFKNKKNAIDRFFKSKFHRFQKQGIWLNTLVELLSVFGMSGREKNITLYALKYIQSKQVDPFYI